jgi:hypothetical protein
LYSKHKGSTFFAKNRLKTTNNNCVAIIFILLPKPLFHFYKQLMYKISTIILFAAFCAGFIGCGSSGYQGESALQKEVFKIHDEVMPLNQTIYLLRKDLIDVKSNGTFDKRMLTANEKTEVDSVCFALTRAEEGMNTWMRAFKEPEFGTAMSTADAYFTAELPKIKAVAEMMTGSVAAAKALTARFPIRAAEAPATPKTSITTKKDTTKKATQPAQVKPDATQDTEPKPTETTAPKTPENVITNEKTPATPKVETPVAPKPTSTTPRVAPAGSKIAR